MDNLNLNISFLCNARCAFCVAGITDGAIRVSPPLSLHDIEFALAEGYRQGATSVTFSGGEPTVHPDLPRAASAARRVGYTHVEIKTNGIRLANHAFTRQLIECGVNSFSVSIHGPSSDVHDRLVGVAGAYKMVMVGLENVRNDGGIFNVPTCIVAANYRALPETIGSIITLKPTFCLPTFVEPSGSAGTRFNELVPLYSDVMPYLRSAISIFEARAYTAWALHGFPMCVLRGFEHHSYDLIRRDRGGILSGDDYFSYEKRHLRAKSEKCASCRFNCVCGGPWKVYADERGWDEFRPITETSPWRAVPHGMLLSALFGERLAPPRNVAERAKIVVVIEGGGQ